MGILRNLFRWHIYWQKFPICSPEFVIVTFAFIYNLLNLIYLVDQTFSHIILKQVPLLPILKSNFVLMCKAIKFVIVPT